MSNWGLFPILISPFLLENVSMNLLLVLLLSSGVCDCRGVSASSPVGSPSEEVGGSPSSLHLTVSPGPSMMLPTSPIYPMLPNGSTLQPLLGTCNVNISSTQGILSRTAGDCMAPLAMYVRNVICCPQLRSMLHILKGETGRTSGSLVLNDTEALECLVDMMGSLVEKGANATTTELCNVKPANLTGGSCPVTRVGQFEQVVDTRKLLDSCSAIDPLRECCDAVCQPAIKDAAVQLALNEPSSDQGLDASGLQQVVDDCEEVVYAWLALELGPESSNSAFRILSSCRVNKVCPLTFNNTSSLVKACGGLSPSETDCCDSLHVYMPTIQGQMLITNIQALECVTYFGSLLKKEGVVANVYNMCKVDLKDFSLQVYGEQGCLLRSIPSDIMYDNVSGISFTCDLNDNIPAPWPASSSLTSFPLCANRESLPALPVLSTSWSSRRWALDLWTTFLMVLSIRVWLQTCKQ